MVTIDYIKATAALLIVLHHLAFYGPLSDSLFELAPGMIAWLYDNARIAVQAFLVVGGFLAARSLAPDGVLTVNQPFEFLRARYFRLAIPFVAALLLTMLAAALSRYWADLDFIPGRPHWKQFLGHVFLLHGVLGLDALSAGAWYVAIDFQLGLMLLGALWLTRRFAPLGLLSVIFLALLSLFYFNRNADWDVWGVYFFGAYAMGVFAYWSRRIGWVWLVVAVLIVVVALLVEFRVRIAVALAVALLLVLAQHNCLHLPANRGVLYLSRISYALFLVHFSILMLANALFERYFEGEPGSALLFSMGVLLLSLPAAHLFHHHIEASRCSWKLLGKKWAGIVLSSLNRIYFRLPG